MKWLALVVGVLVLTAGSVLAAPESSQLKASAQKPEQEFKALTQVESPMSLTDEQLSKIEGASILANFHALPPGNPGTSNAITKIPSAVFTGIVRDQWFGKAAGK